MSTVLTAVAFASTYGDVHAPLEVRRRTSRRKAPRVVMTLYADGGWTRDGDATTLTLDVEAVERALTGQLGFRRVEGSEWTPLAVDGGVEWHATVERAPAPR